MVAKIFLVLIFLSKILGRHAEFRPFYQSGSGWKSKPVQMDFVKDHNDQSRFRPPGFHKFLERRRKEAMRRPPYVNGLLNRQGTVKQMIQEGRFLNAGYVSSEIPPIERMKREGPPKEKSSESIMKEISSVEVLPIIRRSRTIECQRDTDGVVNCHQDDLHYKIRLKHPDLPQDALETLITNLYARLFKATTDKKKRDGTKNVSKNSTEESPFIVVLPPDQVEPAGQNNGSTANVRSSTASINEEMVIECSPTDVNTWKDSDKTTWREDGPKSYVYSCNWHGKRSAHVLQQQKVIVEKVRRGPPLQSFKVLIDPDEVGFNLLPISVLHSN